MGEVINLAEYRQSHLQAGTVPELRYRNEFGEFDIQADPNFVAFMELQERAYTDVIDEEQIYAIRCDGGVKDVLDDLRMTYGLSADELEAAKASKEKTMREETGLGRGIVKVIGRIER